jgi:hypothetical protein
MSHVATILRRREGEAAKIVRPMLTAGLLATFARADLLNSL